MDRSLLSELQADVRSSKLLAALTVGPLLGILLVVPMSSFALIVFSGSLTPLALQAAVLLLVGTLVMTLVSALTSAFKGAISAPFPMALAALAPIGAAVGAALADESSAVQFTTMAAIMGFTSFAAGAALLIAGRFRLANYLRFLPYPVVAGFLAGIGWVLAVGGLETMAGIRLSWGALPEFFDLDLVRNWGPGVAFGAGVFLVLRRWSHFLILPLSIVVCTVLYHAGLAAAGISLDRAETLGILLAEGVSGSQWPLTYLGSLDRVDWGTVATQVPAMAIVVVVTLVSALTNTSGVEASTGVELDMNREFSTAGVVNGAVGLAGSAPGHYVVSLSVASHATGAVTRLTGLVAALVVLAVLVYGTGVIRLIPLPLLGGVVLYLGIDLLNTWALRIYRRLPLVDWGIVILVLVVVAAQGFVEGLGVGLVAAIFLFITRFSRMDPVGEAVSGRGRHEQSRRNRPIPHRVILRELGDRVQSYRLHGFLFFGSAFPLAQRLKGALKADPRPSCILLDFTGVSGFDVSAATALHGIIRAAHPQGTAVVLSAMPPGVRSTLLDVVPQADRTRLHFEEDFDRGLERCEEILLAEWERIRRGDEAAASAISERSLAEIMRRLDVQTAFEDLVERLAPYADARRYAEGETVTREGQRPEGMLLLIEGRLIFRKGAAGIRLQERGAGDIFELPTAASSDLTVEAMEPSRALLLTRSSLQRLEQEDPRLALDLYRYLVNRMEAAPS